MSASPTTRRSFLLSPGVRRQVGNVGLIGLLTAVIIGIVPSST